jgi:subtilisin family serine protease
VTCTRSRTRTRRPAAVALATGLAVGMLGLPVVAGTGSVLSATPASAANPTPWWPAAMGFDDLARAGGTGKGITVAVIDGPIDPAAADIKGKVTSSISVCDVKSTATSSDADHATQIAQLIVGTGASSGGTAGVKGIAPQATLRHYANAFGADSDCLVPVDKEKTTQSTLAAMRHAIKDGARIVSLSYGQSNVDPEMKQAVVEAMHHGLIVVAATGDGSLTFPAGFNGVAAVNGCDSKGKLSDFAVVDHLPGVAFCAPGVGMVIGEHRNATWVAQGSLSNGSSFAAPLVAGGLAAYWSKYPTATANQILQAAVHHPGMHQGTSTNGTKGWIYGYRRVGSGFPEIKGPSKSGFGWGVFAPADLMAVDPATYPDVNPLLYGSTLGPTPQEIEGGVVDSPLVTPTSPSSTATGSATTPTPNSTHTSAAAPGTSSDGGVPGWVWVLAAGVAVGAAGVVIALTRRGAGAGPTSTPGAQAADTTTAVDTTPAADTTTASPSTQTSAPTAGQTGEGN